MIMFLTFFKVNSKSININQANLISFSNDIDNILDIKPIIKLLYEQKYKKWFTIHQPLMEGQRVEEAIEEASNLFLEYKY